MELRIGSRKCIPICSIVSSILAKSCKQTNSSIRQKFKYIIGYTERDFLPHQATSLSMKLCHKLFIECFSVLRALPDLLEEEEGLGAHTGVVLLSTSIAVRYFWCHKTIRPCGDKVPLQCPACYVLRMLNFSAGDSAGKYIVRCRCGWQRECDVGFIGLFPPGGIGWGRQLLYGTEVDFQRVWNSPRGTYDISL